MVSDGICNHEWLQCRELWTDMVTSRSESLQHPEISGGKFTDDDPWQRSKSVRYGSHPVRCLTRWMNFQMYVSTGMNFPKATDGWISSATLRKVALRASKKLDRFTKSMEQSTVSPWPHILFRSLKCSFDRGDPNWPLNQILLSMLTTGTFQCDIVWMETWDIELINKKSPDYNTIPMLNNMQVTHEGHVSM